MFSAWIMPLKNPRLVCGRARRLSLTNTITGLRTACLFICLGLLGGCLFPARGTYDPNDPGANDHLGEYTDNLISWRGALVDELIKSWSQFRPEEAEMVNGLPYTISEPKEYQVEIKRTYRTVKIYSWARKKYLSAGPPQENSGSSKLVLGTCLTELYVDAEGVITLTSPYTNIECKAFYPYPARPGKNDDNGRRR